MAGTGGKEGKFACVFTDRDLAQQFKDQDQRFARMTAVGFDRPADFVSFVESIKKVGFAYVNFDPVGNPRLIPVDAVLQWKRTQSP